MTRSTLSMLIVTGLALGACTGAADACAMAPNPGGGNVGSTTSSPRWRFRKAFSPIPGFVRQELYLNVGLFPPSAPTTCACAFGYGGTPLPGLVPLDMTMILYNSASDIQTPYTVFPTMFPNAGAQAVFSANPGGAGLNWLGFASPPGSVPALNAGNAPVLGLNVSLQLCIRIDVPIPIDALFKNGRPGCVLGAEADPNGFPLPFPQFPHGLDPAAAPFGPGDRAIPAPAAAAVLGLGGLLVARRRR